MYKRLVFACLLVLVSVVSSSKLLASDGEFVYVESNVQSPNGNSILAFEHKSDGSLIPVPGSPFVTGGAGVQDTSLQLGPYDSDQNLIVDRNRGLLFAVNSGSDTVAVFHINSDGSLKTVEGSPFASGGTNPVSVGLAGDILFVVNKNGDFPRVSTTLPNYTAFRIGASGNLVPVTGSTVGVANGSSPSQALIAPHNALLFGADFFGGLLQSFRFNENGFLHQLPPVALPASEFATTPAAPRLPLGLITHPQLPLLYVGFVTVNRLGVYRFDGAGHLNFLKSVPNSGVAICWLRTNPAGTLLFSSNTGAFDTSTVSSYNLSDPDSPQEIQTLTLEGQGNVRQFELSGDGNTLFALTSRFSTLIPEGQGNVLHTISIAAGGTLSETLPPIKFSLPPGTEPQGVAVLTIH